MISFKLLRAIPECGVWALINHRTKKLVLFVADDILGAIARNVRLIKDGEHDVKDLHRDVRSLNVEVLSVVKDKEHQLLHMEHFYNIYRNRGYTSYRKVKGLQYSPRVVVERDKLGGHELYAYVYLVNRHNDKKVMGVFKNVDDANIFVSYAFKRSVVVYPVYARNELTRKYVMGQYRVC